MSAFCSEQQLIGEMFQIDLRKPLVTSVHSFASEHAKNHHEVMQW
jgi:hypothetical protein